MIEGVFKFLQHDHFFLEVSETIAEMRDRFTFAAPLPVSRRDSRTIVVKSYRNASSGNRNQILKQVAESEKWRDSSSRPADVAILWKVDGRLGKTIDEGDGFTGFS
jgi:hypothetical protein